MDILYIFLPLASFRKHTAYVQVPYQKALQVGLSSQQVAAETLVSTWDMKENGQVSYH
jgi:hypothetical protein